MKILFRLMLASLLLCAAGAQAVLAGGGLAEDPYEIGEKLYARKNYRTALRYFQRALWMDPHSSVALERIRSIEEQLKKTSATSEPLERGRALLAKRRYREAEKVLRQAAARDGSNPEIHLLLGDVYLNLGQYGKAKAEYGTAKRLY